MTYRETDRFVINLSKGLIEGGYDVTAILSVDPEERPPRKQESISTRTKVLKNCQLKGELSE